MLLIAYQTLTKHSSFHHIISSPKEAYATLVMDLWRWKPKKCLSTALEYFYKRKPDRPLKRRQSSFPCNTNSLRKQVDAAVMVCYNHPD